MKHIWFDLDYDPRLNFNQPRRYLQVCVNCGMEKDRSARSAGWVIGYRLHGGKRYAYTNLPTPRCLGKLPSQYVIDRWNDSVDRANEKATSQARGYAL